MQIKKILPNFIFHSSRLICFIVMGWTTGVFYQRHGTTIVLTFSSFEGFNSSMSRQDKIVLKAENMPYWTRIKRIALLRKKPFPGPDYTMFYRITVTVNAAQASPGHILVYQGVSYRLSAEKMD